ncbi:MAG: methylmalonyl-CoA decarboxylase subunit alpha [Archaeoglobaceae archaeon]|nr:methylmalonyl-CoA decarboxylase subunit alpha [Archaeoglobaceae archaeon]
MKNDILRELIEKKEKIRRMVGEEGIEKQHGLAKLTARERIENLLDPGSFVELSIFTKSNSDLQAENVITGYGTINRRPVAVFAQEFALLDGTVGEAHGLKIANLFEFAMKLGIPIVGLYDSRGPRIQDGIGALRGFGEIFYRSSLASGLVPQISAILGPCIGPTALASVLADFVIMSKNPNCHLFINPPHIIRAVFEEEITEYELGGWQAQAYRSGNCHIVAEDDLTALRLIRELLNYLPLNCLEDPPKVEVSDPPSRLTPEISETVPEDPMEPYDMREIVKKVLDDGKFFEISENFASNVVTGFGRIDGKTVGIVANNPRSLAGCLDINGCDKITRFVRFCDSFNIPIITFVDVPGFLPGIDQEFGGIIRAGARLVSAYAEATVPMITLIVRRAYGGAYVAMGSKHIGADLVFAYPSAEISVMGPEGAVETIYRDEIERAEDKVRMREMKVREYLEKFANPYNSAERGYVDDIIDPKFTRIKLISSLRILESKRKKPPAKKHSTK